MQKFAIAGIVTEYNPFHLGHGWMIEQLKKAGYGAVVCVMSGPFVQRAEPALLPTHVRAAAAVAGGADLVLRLPVPWAIASAERFGAAGAGLLCALGCVNTLAFGAETPRAEAFRDMARLLQMEEFGVLLRKQLAGGVSFAAARAAAAEELYPGAGAMLRSPNNILGIEYTKALLQSVPPALAGLVQAKKSQGEEVNPPPLPDILPIQRLGAGHDGPPVQGTASASWLRGQVRGHGMPALFGWVPDACLPYYLQAEGEGQLLNAARWETAMLARLRGKGAEMYSAVPTGGEGLGARLAAGATAATTLEELYAAAKTKRFAHSRVRRVALATALGLGGTPPLLPPFIQVLASNSMGRAVLRLAKQTALLPYGTSLAKLAKAGPEAADTVHKEALAEDLFALCQAKPAPGGRAYTMPAQKL